MSYEMILQTMRQRETRTAGRSCVAIFEIHADDYDALRTLVGKRLGVAMVEIGDDENPVE